MFFNRATLIVYKKSAGQPGFLVNRQKHAFFRHKNLSHYNNSYNAWKECITSRDWGSMI